MAKQYGLILPGQQKKKAINAAPARELTAKLSIFNESSDDDDDADGSAPPPQLQKMKSSNVGMGPSAMERRLARQMQAKALAEDPTIFQYDELYDEIESKRDEQHKQTQQKSQEPKKPKYIGRLVQFAERRKLENELRIERQVQKEREAEGEEFKDKEAFVTETYRQKLEDMRKLQEQEQRDEYLEAIGDVTKQKDLDGFYRHIYEQKLGGAERQTVKPDSTTAEVTTDAEATAAVTYKPIKSGKVPQQQQQRAYRKRKLSNDDDDADDKASTEKPTENAHKTEKMHLQNNMDADSDFSIDSSSSDSDSEAEVAVEVERLKKSETTKATAAAKATAVQQTDPTKIALNLKNAGADDKNDNNKKDNSKQHDEPTTKSQQAKAEQQPAKTKRDKNEIWRKRTVGDVFTAAVQRYYERKAERNG